MIEIKNVTKNFGSVNALKDFSLQIKKGEILGLVGPDGAGKTTLIRLMLGLYRQYQGEIRILGQTDIESIKAKLSYIPQRFSLYQDLTVLENIDLIGSLYGIEKAAIHQKAEEILRFTDLWTFRDRLAGKLSGGMKQKLALASGLVHDPLIFFLDEPTTGVDPVARREFWQLLYGLNKKGMTIIAATPYMDEAELCHRIALLHSGQMIRCASPAELIASYPFTVLELALSLQSRPAEMNSCYFLSLQSFGNKYHIITDDEERTIDELTHCFLAQKKQVPELQKISASLEDVFVLFSQEKDKAGDKDANCD
jgi:ABC-2 type transport system ATP-binding protein